MITKKLLKQLAKPKTIESFLIKHLYQYSRADIPLHLHDIVTHGCASGCLSDLIYYADTSKFYTKYEAQIWELMFDYCHETGLTFAKFYAQFPEIQCETSFKCTMSWFAVETVAMKLSCHFLPY